MSKNSDWNPKIQKPLNGSSKTLYVFKNQRIKKACRGFAKNYSDNEGVEPECHPFHHLPPNTPLELHRYKKSDLVNWPLPGGKGQQKGKKIERKSMEQSIKSRMRCAFSFTNSERDFVSMILLSWSGEKHQNLDYETVKSQRKNFLDRLRRKFHGVGYGWFLEFGAANETPHYHFFLTGEPEFKWIEKHRDGDKVDVDFISEDAIWIIENWLECSGQTVDEKARSFCYGYHDQKKRSWQGSIIERLRCPEAAGAYAAKEAYKRVQKHAPWPVSQWWQMSRDTLPKIHTVTDCSVLEYLIAQKEHGQTMASRLLHRLEVPD